MVEWVWGVRVHLASVSVRAVRVCARCLGRADPGKIVPTSTIPFHWLFRAGVMVYRSRVYIRLHEVALHGSPRCAYMITCRQEHEEM